MYVGLAIDPTTNSFREYIPNKRHGTLPKSNQSAVLPDTDSDDSLFTLADAASQLDVVPRPDNIQEEDMENDEEMNVD